MFTAAVILLTASVLAAVVWTWINCSGRGASLDYALNLDHPAGPSPAKRVTIVCPGRDEARWIPETLPELCTQHGVDHRVLYIDDASEDDTPQLTGQLAAQYPNLMVLRNTTEPPSGWAGKTWAIQQGMQHLRAREAAGDVPLSDWLCFTDADIHWHPDCLAAALQHADEHDADFVALLPHVEFGSTSERLALTQMALAIGVVLPLERAMDPRYPDDALGAGAFLLVRRTLYESIGGHGAVAGKIVEDIELSRALKRAGAKVRIAHTQTLLHCRMYEGFADLWEGLTKNAYAALEYSPLRFAALAVGTMICNILPPVYLAAGVAGGLTATGTAATLCWIAAALGALTTLWHIRSMRAVRRMMPVPWVYVLSLPVGSAFYLFIVIASVVRHYTVGNVWKGRRV